ncbi:PDZ domain-containing protein [Aphelenchoides fujianensis]|nr:PDZ domain-containing protein [Aphelenchoides fujianensis]
MAPTNTNDWVESTVEVEVQPTHTLGLTLNTQTPPKITKLLPSSCFLGKLFVGDLILSINGEPVKTMADFFRLSRAANRLAIRLKRDEYCTVRISKATATRPNCDAFDFELMWRSGGMPIGILVYQDSEKRVIVSMIESGTLASTTLRPGDILTKVNDTPVSGKHDAKKASARRPLHPHSPRVCS